MSAALTELPSKRTEAIAAGSLHYFTGRPCRHGHVARRHASNGVCLDCNLAYQNRPESRANFRAYMKEYNRFYEKTPQRRKYAREYQREYNQRRNAAKRNATPPWLTDEHIAEMRACYADAAGLTSATGIPHHVDHIIPLTHPDVQGLHVPWNLQVLTESENCTKNNAFDGTMENETWRRLT